MWPILACSVIAIAVFAERLLYLHRATIHVGEFLRDFPISSSAAISPRPSMNQPAPRARSPASFTRRSSGMMRPGRNCAKSCRKPASSRSQSWNVPRRARRPRLRRTAARFARDRDRNDRRVRHPFRQRRLRDGHRVIQRRLQEFAHDCGRPGGRDPNLRRLQLSFRPGKLA